MDILTALRATGLACTAQWLAGSPHSPIGGSTKAESIARELQRLEKEGKVKVYQATGNEKFYVSTEKYVSTEGANASQPL